MTTALHPSSSMFCILESLCRRMPAAMAAWRLRRRERAELATLTPAELRDAGITPYEAHREACKPFWRE